MLRLLQLKAASTRFFARQHGQRFLWIPVGLMPGIWLYFTLSFEPWAFAGLLSVVLLAAGAYGLRTSAYRAVLHVLLIASIGFTAAQFRTHRLSTPLLNAELFYKTVEGTITAIEPNEDKTRITLAELKIETVDTEHLPKQVRISVRDKNPEYGVGDRVSLKAALNPLPQPTHPDGYDFARHFYFLGIGGMGFSMSKVSLLNQTENTQTPALTRWRKQIATRFRALLPHPHSEIAIAMTIGEKGGIPQTTYDTLRDSGLVHILSISGLHVSLVSGILFFTIRFLLSLWPYMALRIPIKKIAALLALAGAYFYLALADFPLSAQRAFLMVAFVLIAVLVDRRGISLRSIALAASCILLLFPEVLLGASFQLSFAATLAIICLYEQFGHRLKSEQAHPLIKILLLLAATMLTSIIASLATAPYVIFHFNRIALLGIIANVAALPLTSFVIMPALVASILLMPFAGDQLIAYPLRYGLQFLTRIADWAASLPAASLQLHAPGAGGLFAASAGLIIICLLRGKMRLIGVPLWLAGMASIGLHTPAALYISEDVKQVMYREPDGHYVMLKGTARAFAVADWLQVEAQKEARRQKDSMVSCEKNLCHFQLGEKSVMLLTSAKDNAGLDALCQNAPDIAIAPRFINKHRCPQPSMRIGRRETKQYGAHRVKLDKQNLVIETAFARPITRLWQPKLPAERGTLY